MNNIIPQYVILCFLRNEHITGCSALVDRYCRGVLEFSKHVSSEAMHISAR